MILRRIKVSDFRQLAGHNEIDFAPPGDHSVTVVLGENGSGKTTLLNAFLWCLYDRVELENPDEIVSHKAVQDAPVGGEVAAEVTVMFDAHGESYTATRKIRFRKLDGGRLERLPAPGLRVDIIRAKGESETAQDAIQVINQLLPEELTGFFFFRGEDMEALALQGSASKLQEGVETFLDFTVIDRGIKHLNEVRVEFEKDLAKIAKGDIKELTDSIAIVETNLNEAVARVAEKQANLYALESHQSEIERELLTLEATRPLLENKARLEGEEASLRTQRTERRSSIAKMVSDDGFTWVASDALSAPLKLAHDAVQRGDLPAKIKPRFVDDLLEAGRCICGTDLSPEQRGVLQEWKGHAGLAELEAAVDGMRGSIRYLEERRFRSLDQLRVQRTELALAEQRLHQVAGELSAIASELKGKNFGVEHIHQLQQALRKVMDDIVDTKVALQRSKDDIDKLKENLEFLQSQRKAKSKEQAEVQVIERRIDATQAVGQRLEEVRRRWSMMVQEYLDQELKNTWQRIAQLDRLVEFTPEFRLSIKEIGGDGTWRTSAPSSANLRAVALSFIAALIKLAAAMEEDEGERAALTPFRGGKYPLVMDAPFATMDTDFKSRVPVGLRAVVPQLVIFSSYDQWTGDVENALGPSVGARYVLRLHRPGDIDSGKTVNFGNGRVDYVVAEPNTHIDWSEIQEVSA
jgi:DNA sulfur modification protein DndD